MANVLIICCRQKSSDGNEPKSCYLLRATKQTRCDAELYPGVELEQEPTFVDTEM